MGQSPECAVGRGVAVAADDGHARLGTALLRPHDVNDAVARIAHLEDFDPGARHIALQRLELQPRLGIGDMGEAEGLTLGRHIVVGDRQGAIRPTHPTMRRAQAGEGLRRRHLMDEVQVDIEDGLAVGVFGNDVGVPDLFIECLWR